MEQLNDNWITLISDNEGNSDFTKFHNIIRKAFEDMCFKTEGNEYSDKPWITTGIKQSIKIKHDLYSIYLKPRTNEDKAKWKIYKVHY